jgi:hypothetical protein
VWEEIRKGLAEAKSDLLGNVSPTDGYAFRGRLTLRKMHQEPEERSEVSRTVKHEIETFRKYKTENRGATSYVSTLKMEARSSEMSVDFEQIFFLPEERIFHNHICESFKFCGSSYKCYFIVCLFVLNEYAN